MKHLTSSVTQLSPHILALVKTRQWTSVFIFSGFFLLFLHAIEDPDLWFHMTIGRAVLEQGSVPVEEFYIFTRIGQISEFHEWGFGVIYQAIYDIFGLYGVIIFNALTGALTVFILYLVARQREASIAIAVSVAAIAYWLMEFRFVQRPEDFLYLALAATIYFIEAYRKYSNWWCLSIIPIIGLVLSQIHPSVLMLGLVTGTYLVEALFRKKPNMTQVYHLGVVIVFTLTLSLINPYGLEQLILPVKFSLQADFLQSFNEFLPSMSTGYAYRYVIALLLAAYALSAIRKRFSLAEWLMLAAFSYLAYHHVRDIALLGIALTLPLATALNAHLNRNGKSLIFTTLLLSFVAIDASQLHRYSFDIDPVMAPISGAEVVEKYSRSTNILNFYHLGNYLAWRLGDSHKVIIDGRNFKENDSLILHDKLLSAKHGWEKALLQYDIDTIVTPVTLPYSGDFIPLVFKLIRNPNWLMVNSEPAGVVFIRKDRIPLGAKFYGEQDLWLQAKAELNENLKYFPNSKSTLQSMIIVENNL